MPIATSTKTSKPAATFLLVVVTAAAAHSACSPRAPTITGSATAAGPRSAAALGAEDLIFFDDFSYESRAAFTSHGWIVRTAPGWPGIPGAVWSTSNVSFLADAGNRVLRMTSSLGESVSQTQICQQRKFLEGTYAARVRFTDTSLDGSTGDEVVESFYTITPYRRPMDPAYSEIDFEYLPAGGWQKPAHTLMTTSWETTQMEPPRDLNAAASRTGHFEGWHTLTFQALDGQVSYFIDGEPLARHHKPNYPDAPMSLNFNLWFIRRTDALPQSTTRFYIEEIDWVLHVKDRLLTPQQVARGVDELRNNSVLFRDTVPAADPPLDSPCDL